ncbi:nucleotidyltransferase family protein [Oceanobacillus manasiensis]|uniref:nucleotidyltransferase family protein n=1 Tax=Oceanobacillus manasiensis TaxID=586413 RepID=UPI0005AB48A4|nr:nucleotidyltransferase family protein [Oceanobacillus manasiensis]
MMRILKAAQKLELPDWWICAGFVRSKIWDTLHQFREKTPMPDVDVIYFDKTNIEEKEEKRLEERLRDLLPNVPWSVKNQARMHIVNQVEPYKSSENAISKFPETATAIGVKLDQNNQVKLTAPWGIEDVLNLQVKPTPYFMETSALAAIYDERVTKKEWQSIWHKLEIYSITSA